MAPVPGRGVHRRCHHRGDRGGIRACLGSARHKESSDDTDRRTQYFQETMVMPFMGCSCSLVLWRSFLSAHSPLRPVGLDRLPYFRGSSHSCYNWLVCLISFLLPGLERKAAGKPIEGRRTHLGCLAGQAEAESRRIAVEHAAALSKTPSKQCVCLVGLRRTMPITPKVEHGQVGNFHLVHVI